MDPKKQTDRPTDKPPTERRPDNMAGQRQATYDPAKPDITRRQPEAPEDRKEFGKPEGYPYDKEAPKKEAPKPGMGQGKQDEGERSDRSSGRPVQLDKGSESAKR